MQEIQRRSFLQLALAMLPASLMSQESVPGSGGAPGSLAAGHLAARRVAAGEDRQGRQHVIGVSSTTYKVLTEETGGAMFVMEQLNHKRGGPTRHLHHGQDELFYVIEGKYIVEVGSERFELGAGDCVLGSREIPHAWAFVGETTGRLLLSYAPAGKMEAFFNDREKLGIKPGTYSSSSSRDVANMHAYGMEHVGPPLMID